MRCRRSRGGVRHAALCDGRSSSSARSAALTGRRSSANTATAAIAYASKAFMVTAMCALVAQEGLWLDVASAGELYTANCADFPMEQHPLPRQLQVARRARDGGRIRRGVSWSRTASSSSKLLSAIAEDAGKVQDDPAPVQPGRRPAHAPADQHRPGRQQVRVQHQERLRDGGRQDGARACQGLNLAGVHCHVGSQLLDLTPLRRGRAGDGAVHQADQRRDRRASSACWTWAAGSGVRYLEEHNPPTIEEFAKTVSEAVISGGRRRRGSPSRS